MSRPADLTSRANESAREHWAMGQARDVYLLFRGSSSTDVAYAVDEDHPPGPIGTTEHALGVAPQLPQLDIESAVRHLEASAHEQSEGRCAQYVREAIEAGGLTVPLPRPRYAKDYSPVLIEIGFREVSPDGYTPLRGDVAVIQPPANRVEGHIQMFNGHIWISDFRQRTDLYPGPAYRRDQPAYRLFRWPLRP